MKLVEITREEVINNCEKYFENGQQFFVKIKHIKELRTAYLYHFVEWDDILKQEMWSYRFKYDDDEDLDQLDEGFIQHIYIIK